MSVLFATAGVVFFPLLVLRAGIGDLATMRIPNPLVVALLLGYGILAPLAGVAPGDMALSLVAGLVVFCLGLGAFACGWMGGGDVKLMAASALWLGLPHLPAFLMFTAVFGAVLTLALLIYRAGTLPYAVAGRVSRVRSLWISETRVPYGVAIAAAALWVFASTQWVASVF